MSALVRPEVRRRAGGAGGRGVRVLCGCGRSSTAGKSPLLLRAWRVRTASAPGTLHRLPVCGRRSYWRALRRAYTGPLSRHHRGHRRSRSLAVAAADNALTETCEPDSPNLITHVATTDSTVQDVRLVAPVHAHLAERDLLPDRHLGDAGYATAREVVTARRNHEVNLVGPILASTSRQTKDGGFSQADFAIDWENRQVTCPNGSTSSPVPLRRGVSNSPDGSGAAVCDHGASAGRRWSVRRGRVNEGVPEAACRLGRPGKHARVRPGGSSPCHHGGDGLPCVSRVADPRGAGHRHTPPASLGCGKSAQPGSCEASAGGVAALDPGGSALTEARPAQLSDEADKRSEHST